ncbi:L-malyl-CoA/beta-methylmalyl-CoA lyase [Baekduia alba]|uniref:HpcH/HpaI aldolase/citrate lyase family protein n=1 Tax=Baekduia alba TaxID=2997333 RepID=UPI00233FA55F|nr:CoA ester lyase [Baekduia alba]WCB93423.1 L-malyl-CoA/beta-methylmalyl-CoA lyase [Baekduia alba]
MSAPPPLTLLYAPADRPELMNKAVVAGADVVIVDLEDAVAPAHKAAARRNVAALLAQRPPVPVDVRINDPRSPLGRDDLAAIRDLPGLGGVRIPKVDDPDVVRDVATALDAGARGLALHCLLESGLGVERAHAIAAADPSVGGIGLGEADLAAELGAADDGALDWARGRVVIAARAAGLPAPAQSVYGRLGDRDGLAASCRRGRAQGFFGRAAIHPAQLPVIVEAYRPAAEEVRRARELVDAAAVADGTSTGALVLPDGRFVDAAFVKGAERTLAVARRLGMVG